MKYKLIAAVCFILISSFLHAQIKWPAISNTTKPWTRWWWMGSAVDEKNISSLLKEYHDAGFGGVEVVPIYGVKGYESKYIPYLSPQWMQMLDTTVQVAHRLNMGVDVSVGTGWPIGGPQVSLEDAATRMHFQQYKMKAGEPLHEKIIINLKNQQELPAVRLAALMAYGANNEVIDITSKVLPDGTLQWTPPEAGWELLALFTAKTLQKVKRAAPGGEGYTLDHFSDQSINHYFKLADEAFGNSSHGVSAFFNDSYEVYDANWTPDFLNAFQKRRGYDLRKYLRELSGKDSSELVARIKSDYRETMAELMLDNFAQRFTQWSHSKHARSINQAHGSPGNLLDLYAAFDIPETETFGSSYFPIPGLRRDSADIRNVDPDPTMLKFASSAAHTMGRPLASCETFTWLGEHFKTSWAQCKPELEQVFLSGLNHIFFHGTTYSPADAAWPGWLFYASVNFVPANSLWSHLNGLNDYITRCQSVLQAGQPDNELAVYWPVYDVWNNPKGTDMSLKVHDVDEWLHPSAFYKNVMTLQDAGYTLDFVSDKMIGAALVKNSQLKVDEKGAAYKVLLIPECKLMTLETLEKIKALAASGATVIFQKLPGDVPGLYQLDERRKKLQEFIASLSWKEQQNGISEMKMDKGRILLCGNVSSALQYAGLLGEPLSGTGLKFIRRSVNDGKYYYLVNHTDHAIDTFVHILSAGKAFSILDPQTAKTGLLQTKLVNGKTLLRIQLKPGEAWIVKTSNSAVNAKPWPYISSIKNAMPLTNKWQVSFTSGGPELPKTRTIASLSSWTAWGDTTLENFSGTAVYTTNFFLPAKTASDYLLQLGKVCESAKVWINGKEAGLLWSIPFETRIGHLLKQGNNEIKIEVSNLMANRIKYMDRNKMPWRNYHEINFVNINYKNFDATDWPLQPSGLIGPVTISAITTSK